MPAAKQDINRGGPGPDATFSSRGLAPLDILREKSPLPLIRYEGLLPQAARQLPERYKRTVLEVGVATATNALTKVNQATTEAVGEGIPHNDILIKLSGIRTESRNPESINPVNSYLADAGEQLTWHAVSRQPGFAKLSETGQQTLLENVGEQTQAFVERILYADTIAEENAEALADKPKKSGTVFERTQRAKDTDRALEGTSALIAVQRQTRRGEILPQPSTREEQLRLFQILERPSDRQRRWTQQEMADAF